TFAYNCIYAAGNRIPKFPEKIIDVILVLQAEDGLWHDSNHSFFSSMDSIYILSHLSEIIGYKTKEVYSALEKATIQMGVVYKEEKEYLQNNTHAMLSIVHALGLLRDALPDHFICSEPWKFDWDKT